MAFTKVLILALVAAINLQEIYGHGMMMDPVNRSSAWRKGFPVPPNHTDNEHFCGGAHQDLSYSRCGECGDRVSMPRPRPNENGGLYGTGVIVRKYEEGNVIDVMVRLTASHLGYFEFHLCPLKHDKELETNECFNKYPLQLADGSGLKFPITKYGSNDYNLKLVLPQGVTCKQCVVRWTYRTGNTWGRCPDGRGAMGCGNQETFRSCSDVSISPKGSLAGVTTPEVPADVPENV